MPREKNKVVENKRQRNQKQVKQKMTRQKGDDLAEVDLDKLERELETRTKMLKGRRAVADKPKKVRNKRMKNQPELSGDESNDELIVTNPSTKKNPNKRIRQDEGVQTQTVARPTKKRKVLVDKDRINKNIREVFNGVGKKLSFTYTAGDQAAQTTLNVNGHKFVKKTANNIHAEMGVLNDAMEKDESEESLLTITENGMIVVTDDDRALNPAEFKTTNANDPTQEMDHCGYCTFFLTMMDVPTGRPTFQPSRNSGSQNAYPLPGRIRENPAIIGKVLGYENAEQFVNEVKEGIEAYYQASASKHRLPNLSAMENILKGLNKTRFDEWNETDNENGESGERFNSLLKDVFGHKKLDFLNSLWDPVITGLTTIMKQTESQRKAFLKSNK
jgi:hypothetical protein